MLKDLVTGVKCLFLSKQYKLALETVKVFLILLINMICMVI